MRERVARLKQQLFALDDRTVFWERMLALRRAHEQYGGERPTRLYALALRKITETMSVVIGEDELIVGEPREVLLSIDEEQQFATQAADYFQPSWYHTRGHVTLAWDLLLERGLLGIQGEAAERMAALDADEADAAPRREFWEAIGICCQAVVDLAARYADTAMKMAESAPPPRRGELEQIAAACRRVPALPARSFYEAVQSVWFLDFVLHAVCGARDYAVGRLDQHLLPFYRRDVAAGALTREAALELLQCLFVKMNRFIGLHDHYTTPVKRSPCVDSVQYLVVAGQHADGRDATNELSSLCLQAVDELRLKEPTLTVRHHPGMDRSFWRGVCDAVRRGASVGIYNDEVMIASLTTLGFSLEEARYVHHNLYAGGLATTADALAALKQAVYEEGWLTRAEVCEALAGNFTGREALRQRLLTRCPKFGNDDDGVDGIAAEIAECFCRAVLAQRDPLLGACWPGLYTYHRFKRIGAVAGATPDGRLAGTPTSENQGPAPGRARLGPTATLRSLAKLPLRLTPSGGQTLTLHPTLFSGPEGAQHLSELIETYFRLGGQHLQVNIMDPETLRAAQRDPEQFRDLVVRVTGYSAYFVTLDRQSQDLLIAAATG